jgi:hypothetical protein
MLTIKLLVWFSDRPILLPFLLMLGMSGDSTEFLCVFSAKRWQVVTMERRAELLTGLAPTN